jgi:phosphoglycolate phosphatase
MKALALDFDGVILESMDLKVRVFRELFAAPPAVRDRIERLYVETGGMSIFDQFTLVHRDILRRALPPAELAALDREFRRRVDADLARCPLVRGTAELLARRAGELPLFVVSGVPEDDLRRQVTRRGLDRFFRSVTGAPRPKPDLLRAIVAAHGWAPGEVVFVGDGPYDEGAAAEAGVGFVGRVPAGRPSPFHDGALAIVADLAELDARWLEIAGGLQARRGG